jgi:hypothetical protein
MSRRDPNTGMRQVTKERTRFGHAGGVVPLKDIVSQCSLAPVLPEVLIKGEVTPKNSMARFNTFYVNRFGTHSLYATLAEK